MPPVAVELPYQSWVRAEGTRRSEVGGIIGAPEAAGAAKGWKPGRGREACSEDCEDSLGALKVGGE